MTAQGSFRAATTATDGRGTGRPPVTGVKGATTEAAAVGAAALRAKAWALMVDLVRDLACPRRRLPWLASLLAQVVALWVLHLR